MDRRRLSACANFVGYSDAMGYINQPYVSIKIIQSYRLDYLINEK